MRPFEAVPAWVAERLRPQVDRAADEVLNELRRGDPPLGDEEAGRARAGIAAGIRHFCDLVEDPGAGWERVAAFYLRVGRHLARDGRDPVEVQQALRRSALAAWRTLAAVPGGLDLDLGALSLVVDAQFCYMDAVAEVIAAGYAAEVAARADGAAGG
ncbi:PucR family transcriptional regulator, partial [Actinomadura montaniterrae]